MQVTQGSLQEGGENVCRIAVQYVGADISCSLCLLEVIHLCGLIVFDVNG